MGGANGRAGRHLSDPGGVIGNSTRSRSEDDTNPPSMCGVEWNRNDEKPKSHLLIELAGECVNPTKGGDEPPNAASSKATLKKRELGLDHSISPPKSKQSEGDTKCSEMRVSLYCKVIAMGTGGIGGKCWNF